MEQSMRVIWAGKEQEQCVFLCEKFRAAGIPFRVNQRTRQFLKGVDEHYKIFVPKQNHAAAAKILAEGRLDFTDSPEDQKIMELAEGKGPSSIELLRSHSKNDSSPPHGVVTVFCEGTSGERGKAQMVEASLRENDIACHVEALADGSRNVLVSTKDESLAREIVREITDGVPPT